MESRDYEMEINALTDLITRLRQEIEDLKQEGVEDRHRLYREIDERDATIARLHDSVSRMRAERRHLG